MSETFLNEKRVKEFWEHTKSVFSNKQNKLEGKPGEVVGFDNSGSAVPIQSWSNPNLLKNWNFRNPVNRNGRTEYSGTGYTIDRWFILNGSGSVKITQNGVVFTALGGPFSDFRQIMAEQNHYSGDYTLSFLTPDGLFSATGRLVNNEGAVGPFAVGNGLAYFLKEQGMWQILLRAESENSIPLIACKLEFGSKQTLANQNEDGNWVLNDPPDYDLQYVLCGQYSPITGEWIGYQHSNRNVLDNSYFIDPVNQNGRTEYTSIGYTIDRWYIWSIGKMGTVKIGNGVTLTGEEGTSIVFDQRLDEALELYGKIVTISILVESVVGKFELQITDSFSKEFSESGLISMTGVISNAGNETPTFRVFNVQPNSSCIIKAAKLELGPVQTLAHQNKDGSWVLNDPPNYDLQYALCSQYSPITGEWIGSQHSNLNLLDNWYFVDPLNQRGKTAYTGNGYTIDRWRLFNYSGNMTISISDGITIHFGEDAQDEFVQMFPLEYYNFLSGKAITMSVLVNGTLHSVTINVGLDGGTSYVQLLDGMYAHVIGNWNDKFFVGLLSDGTSKDFTIEAMKLELGPQQTLAHQDADGNWVLNDPPPNKAVELAKCQRYYLGFSRWEFWPVVNVEPNYIDFSIPVPVKMRIAPSVHNLVSDWLDSSWSLSSVVNGSSSIRVRAYKENHGLTMPLRPVEALDYAGLSADL